MTRTGVIILLAASLLLGNLTARQERGPSGGAIGKKAAQAVDEPSPAALKLKEASSHRRTSFKKPAEEKRRILLEAAALYEGVIRDFPDYRSESAQAGFRAGEIYRTVGLPERAEKAFLLTLKFDAKGEFAARSLNEVGHLFRRKKEYRRALEYYSRVQKECPDIREQCAVAVTWTGKVLLKQEQGDRGRQVLLGFSDRFPEFPVQAIRNIDLAACSLIKEGRISEAAAMVQSCRDRFAGTLTGEKEENRKIETALQKMKAPEMLDAASTENAGRGEGN